jgi:toxin ParE1/3/4
VSRRFVKVRPAARRDVATAAQWYAKEGGFGLANRFITSVRTVFERNARHAASGSPRYATLVGIAGLRNHPLKDFPYLIFYVEHVTSLDVVRVLHASRDLPESLQV